MESSKDKEKRIRQLLDLYFEGGTTIEQEKELRGYFSCGEVPDDLLYARAMFGAFGALAGDECPAQVGVPGAADGEAECSGDAGKLSEADRGRKFGVRRMIYIAASVAAVLCLATLITLDLTEEKRNPTVYCYVNGQPVTDYDMAFKQAQMASRILESGARISADSFAVLDEAAKPIGEHIARMFGAAGETEE